MGSVRIRLCAAVGAAVGAAALISLCGPAAAVPAVPGPEGQKDMTLSPAVITAGGDLDIRTRSCGRTAITGTVSSTAFVSTVKLAPAADGGMFAQGVVRSTVSPGSYTVVINCEGAPRAAEGRLTVSERGDDKWGEHKPASDDGHQEQWGGGQEQSWGDQGTQSGGQEKSWGGGQGTQSGGGQQQWGGSQEKSWEQDKQWGQGPYAPVHAGGGGTAELAANTADDQEPPESGMAAGVAAGLLAVAGAAGLALHRRRRRAGQD